jgi:hypothetical protein
LVDREHEEAGSAADCRGARKCQQHGRPYVDPNQMSRDRVADDGAQGEAKSGAIERDMHGRRQCERADQHDEMIDTY